MRSHGVGAIDISIVKKEKKEDVVEKNDEIGRNGKDLNDG